MRHLDLSSFSVLSVIINFAIITGLTNCQGSKFNGGSGTKNPASADEPNPPRDNEQTPKDPETTDPEVVFDEGNDCFHTQPTLSFMFVIDRTGSMQPSISTVINNVGAFSKSISSLKPEGSETPFKDSKFGAVTFMDTVAENRYIEFTADPQAFSTQLNKQQAIKGTGGDACEGGLQAARAGLERLNQSITSGQAVVPVLIVISDDFAHNGQGSDIVFTRNFSDADAVTAASSKNLKPLLLYDAVPTSRDGFSASFGCTPSGLARPSLQWDALRSKIAAANSRDAASVGESLGFRGSFDSSTLLDSIPSMIAKTVKMCK